MRKRFIPAVVTIQVLLLPTFMAAQNTVMIETGKVKGFVGEGVLSFKGVPYAAPPIGDLRWRAPQPAAKWSGVREANAYGHDCMQLPFPSDAAPLGTDPAEDCLVLNVWAPEQRPGKLPVLVWIYAQVSDDYNAAYANIQPLFWLVRTRGEPHPPIPDITEQLRIVSDGFPLAHIRTMDEVMGHSTARQSFQMLLLTIFGAVALLLAAIGICAMMAYSVEQRNQEMGIRMALGADRSAIRKLVIGHGISLALAGVIVGLCAAFALTNVIASLLFGVKAWDAAAFICAPVILFAVALIAAWLPAERASKLDPMHALRRSKVMRYKRPERQGSQLNEERLNSRCMAEAALTANPPRAIERVADASKVVQQSLGSPLQRNCAGRRTVELNIVGAKTCLHCARSH